MKPYYESKGITIYCGDSFVIAPEVLAQADLTLSDPPYGLGKSWKRTWHGDNGKTRFGGEIPEWDHVATQKCFDILLQTKHSVVWGGNQFATPPCGNWLIWDKIQKSVRAECEMAWTTLKAGHKIFRMSRIDAYWNKAEFKKEHPAEKPIQLMEWCLSWFKDSKVVIDPFMGVGSSLVAAQRTGRRAIGIELNEKYCEIAASRLDGSGSVRATAKRLGMKLPPPEDGQSNVDMEVHSS